MKVILDTHVLFKLPESYPGKCEEVLYRALEAAHNNFAHSQAEFYLDMDAIIRLNAIERRKEVGLKEHARDVLNHLNAETGKSFRPVDTNLIPIVQLLKNHYEKSLIIQVIDNKVAKWKGTDMEDYLRPSTLFRPSKFEAYANESVAPEVAEKKLAKEFDALLGD